MSSLSRNSCAKHLEIGRGVKILDSKNRGGRGSTNLPPASLRGYVHTYILLKVSKILQVLVYETSLQKSLLGEDQNLKNTKTCLPVLFSMILLVSLDQIYNIKMCFIQCFTVRC